MEISISIDVAEDMADVVRRYSGRLETLNVFDTRFYPPKSSDAEDVVRYFMVMVSLDHRLSRPGKPYEACLDDGCYHGADLLYRLGMRIYNEDPDFFSPKRLSRITVEEVVRAFSVGDVKPPDPVVRTLLLRDLGVKLLKIFDGRALRLIELSEGRLKGDLAKPGFIDLLKIFRAYEDPVEKKSYLLAKFLHMRGILKIVDWENAELPIDNHLSRIAYRTGLVRVGGILWRKIKAREPVSATEDVLLRLMVRLGYKIVSEKSRINPFTLDDFLWIHGRSRCFRDTQPKCGECIFKDFCRAYRDSEFMVSEHIYYNTWYY